MHTQCREETQREIDKDSKTERHKEKERQIEKEGGERKIERNIGMGKDGKINILLEVFLI